MRWNWCQFLILTTIVLLYVSMSNVITSVHCTCYSFSDFIKGTTGLSTEFSIPDIIASDHGICYSFSGCIRGTSGLSTEFRFLISLKVTMVSVTHSVVALEELLAKALNFRFLISLQVTMVSDTHSVICREGGDCFPGSLLQNISVL